MASNHAVEERVGACRHLPSCWVCFASAASSTACSFDTQPLFEAAARDGGIAEFAGGNTAGPAAALEQPNQSREDADASGAASPVAIDAGSGSAAQSGGTCTPGAVRSCRDGAASTCKPD